MRGSRYSIHDALKTLLSLVFLTAGFVYPQENYYNHTELDWRTIETEHFFVHFHNGEVRSARVIAKVAEDIYGPVTSLYQHEPSQKVSIVVKDYDDYANGGAYFFDNKIEIWAPALDYVLRGNHNWLRNVITHEFTHIVQIQTSMKFGRRFPGIYFQWLNYEEERRQDVLYGYPNTVVSYPISGFIVPSWFAEGVAQYNRPELSYDYWDSHRDMILRSYVLDGNMLSWQQMCVFGKTSLGNESSYNAGFALVRYISEHYGQDAIPRIAKNISRINNVDIDQAIDLALGKSGQALYNEWKDTLTAQYREKTAPIRDHIVAGATITPDGSGDQIGTVGFANLNPSFSPDGKSVAYTSNKRYDYFGLSNIYIADLTSHKEKAIVLGVSSELSWSPDGTKIYYTKHSTSNPGGSNYSDIYVYDLKKEEETRLTYARRAVSVSVSPDGLYLAFSFQSDGTMNIGITDSLGKNFRQVTGYQEGEQVYLPRWSPDGTTIVFGYALRDAQDVAQVSRSGGTVAFLVPGIDDARDPVYTPDGSSIIFSSDRTGIPNLYAMNLADRSVTQLTNVLGGAFMPTVRPDGTIVYALYTSSGYKLRVVEDAHQNDFLRHEYVYVHPQPKTDIDTSLPRNKFDWQALRNYDDTQFRDTVSRQYKNIFTSLSLIPFLRIDNYNTKSSGLDFLKPGFYFISSDVLDKMNLFGGAAINHILERDLFAILEYRDRIIGLHQLGINPTISLEVYNITRKREAEPIILTEGVDESQADITYSLFEFDLYFKQHLIDQNDVFSAGISRSIYSTSISSFYIPKSRLLVPASSDDYFHGTMLSLEWRYNGIVPSRYSEINPVGMTFSFRYEYNINRFNSDGSYEVTSDGNINPVLKPFDFHRAEFKITNHFSLPYWSHTLSFTLTAGTIFGPEVPDFFDFYAGGLVGMKGYPFYSLGGNEITTLNVAYRYPIWNDIDFKLLQLYFDKLYGEFHADYGNAWNGLPNIRDFKKDVGFELRLEAFSWYGFPTDIFFNGTYGLDSFQLSNEVDTFQNSTRPFYGHEWRFYFGVLFGFDFSNNAKRFFGGFQ